MIRVLAFLAALVLAAPAFAQKLPANLDKNNAIVIDTTKGRIVIALRADLAPKHAERIKQLARDGYYNNVPFHRVIDGFMAQTGDGQNFNGTGGSKYPNLKQEFSSEPFKRGTVGMARAATATIPPTRSSSSASRDASFLNNKYTVIGNVVPGMDVVDKIKKAPPGREPPCQSRQDGQGAGRLRRQVTRRDAMHAQAKARHRRRAAPDRCPVAGRAGRGQAGQYHQGGVRALGTCWKPPPASRAKAMDITIIVSFNRSGAIMGRPRITYESPEATDNDRLAYRVAVMEALQRCTPMPFTESMAGAVAGHPFAVRFRNPP